MCRERQQFLCYGKTSQLHEQDHEKAVFYHRQTDYAAAIKVSMAIRRHTSSNIAICGIEN